MTPDKIARIEAEARRVRAEVLIGMVRALVRLVRAPIVAGRTA